MFKHIKPPVLIEITLHLLFWVFITFIPILSRPANSMFRGFFSLWHLVLMNLLLAIQFYLNAFVLIPVILNKNKQILLYFVLLLFSFIVLDLIIIYTRPAMVFPLALQKFGPPPPLPFFAGFNLLPLTAITAGSFAYRYLADQFRLVSHRRDLANASLVSELAFLRSQISPHFIFNVINSAVALSRLNPAAVEPTLIKLSRLLRYMLYVTDEGRVTMSDKAEYLSSYIELQRLRFGGQVRIDASFNITAPEKTIEPMLLVPFVENAFKYGTGNINEPLIIILLRSDNKTLNFTVRNIFDPDEQHNDNAHGIGLNNVKRRLALLYPGKHSLVINNSGSEYSVNLQIELK
jgi:hypothetical protein